jgi:hypothetical protein
MLTIQEWEVGSMPKPATERDIREDLFQALLEATAGVNVALAAFKAGMTGAPNLPPSEAVKRANKVSRELSLARKEMRKAHNLLNDFLSLDDFLNRKAVEEDPKQTIRQFAGHAG